MIPSERNLPASESGNISAVLSAGCLQTVPSFTGTGKFSKNVSYSLAFNIFLKKKSV